MSADKIQIVISIITLIYTMHAYHIVFKNNKHDENLKIIAICLSICIIYISAMTIWIDKAVCISYMHDMTWICFETGVHMLVFIFCKRAITRSQNGKDLFQCRN